MPDDFGDLVVALRCVQDQIRLADLPAEQSRQAAEHLRQVAGLASRHPGTLGTEPTSRRPDLPGRGNAVIPGFVMNDEMEQRSVGAGMFSAAHLGRGAVHGGSITLIFDEVMGRLIEREGRQARTAYLHVDFRGLVPIDVRLELNAKVDREDGRKVFASANLRQGALVLADAEGLWVTPRFR